MHSVSLHAIAIRFVVITSVSLATIWISLGRMAAEKVATAIAMPVGIIWMLLLFACAVAIARREKASAMFIFMIWLAVTFAGSGFVAGWVADSLESPFLAISPLEEEPFHVVVVLGGGGSIGGNNRMQGNSSGDRLILAAQLFHQGITENFICTGKRIESMNSSGVDPSDVSAEVLQKLGVPESAIEKLGGRNTSEEMKTLGERFGTSDKRIGILTSAWHLPRALRLARRNNFNPQPLPADFRKSPDINPPTTGEVLLMLIPSADALAANTAMGKEYLGMLVGR
ncbi:MAG: ElyC/SanA/YdcF family protein [Planctomycetaceae bacterium]